MYYANVEISITSAVVKTMGVTIHKNNGSVCILVLTSVSIWFEYSRKIKIKLNCFF